MNRQVVRMKDSKESEKTIIEVLKQHHGTMLIEELFSATKTAGLLDDIDILIRSALWHLISQARIKRDANTVSVV